MPSKSSNPVYLPLKEKFQILVSNARWAVELAWKIAPRLFMMLVILTLFQSIMPAVQALVARQLTNDVISAVGLQAGFASLVPWLFIGVGSLLFQEAVGAGRQYYQQIFADQLRLKISVDTLSHANCLEVSFFEDPYFQDVIERAQQNIAVHISEFINNLLLSITNAFQGISVIIILLGIDPVTVIVIAPVILPSAIFYWQQANARYLLEYHRTSKRRWTRYFSMLLMSSESVAEIKLLDLGPLLTKRYQTLMEEFTQDDAKLYRRQFKGELVFSVLFSVVFYTTFAWIAWKVIQNVLTVGDLVVYGRAATQLRSYLEGSSNAFTTALEKALYVADLNRFLNTQPAMNSSRIELNAAIVGDIKLQNVTFTYPGSSSQALVDVSLHIRAGEVVALVGENGAGKSTLVKLIARLYDPTAGLVLLDDVDLRELSLDAVHGSIAFVMQNFNRYEATAAENIAFGDWQNLLGNRDRIKEVAHMAGAYELIDQMPDGYETLLGRKFGEFDLSGGQWQKLALARAFAREARILILDEPTSNLDARAEYDLFCRFRELAQGRTTILISHRFSTVSMADRIIMLEKGQIIGDGTHEDLLKSNPLYAELYELHQRQMISTV